jgi:hypothetical protein
MNSAASEQREDQWQHETSYAHVYGNITSISVPDSREPRPTQPPFPQQTTRHFFGGEVALNFVVLCTHVNGDSRRGLERQTACSAERQQSRFSSHSPNLTLSVISTHHSHHHRHQLPAQPVCNLGRRIPALSCFYLHPRRRPSARFAVRARVGTSALE